MISTRGMTRTPWKVSVAQTNTKTVYRTVYKEHGHYYVMYNSRFINVDRRMEDWDFVHKDMLEG